MNNPSVLNRKSAIYMVRNIMNVLFPLVTFKYASTILGAQGVGAANYSSAIVSYFGLIAQLGINSYAISRGSRLISDRKQFVAFSDSIFTINLISTIVSYLCLFGSLLFVGKLQSYKLLILIYSVSILFTSIGVEWMFVINEKFLYITIRSVFFQAISLALLLMFVHNQGDVWIYAVLSVLATSASGILNFVYAKKSYNIGITSLKNCSIHVKPIFTIWIANIASLIYVNADTIIIGSLIGDSAVGFYTAATKIVKGVCVPIASFATVSGPSLSLAIGQNNKNEINRIANHVLKSMTFFVFPFIVGLFVLRKEAILLLSGEEFLSATSVILILLLDILLSPLNSFLANQVLIPAHKERFSMLVMIVAAIANVILDILLIPTLGINGAAIATVVSELTVTFFCLFQAMKIFDLSEVCKGCINHLLASIVIIPISIIVSQQNIEWHLKTALIVLISIFAYLGCSRIIQFMLHKKST